MSITSEAQPTCKNGSTNMRVDEAVISRQLTYQSNWFTQKNILR